MKNLSLFLSGALLSLGTTLVQADPQVDVIRDEDWDYAIRMGPIAVPKVHLPPDSVRKAALNNSLPPGQALISHKSPEGNCVVAFAKSLTFGDDSRRPARADSADFRVYRADGKQWVGVMDSREPRVVLSPPTRLGEVWMMFYESFDDYVQGKDPARRIKVDESEITKRGSMRYDIGEVLQPNLTEYLWKLVREQTLIAAKLRKR
ncbi:MAG: hypothetical protein HY399_08780 [Elusimicrobia bacterium]|nr:hypothetical protein [Elusimicrobiota bacterium]